MVYKEIEIKYKIIDGIQVMCIEYYNFIGMNIKYFKVKL